MITIVIPTFNHAQYLPIQIASIISQGPLISRIIVVNDNSVDDTADILAKIQINEPRLMIKNLTNNVGFLQAAHIGLSYVETDFFAFASADDFLMPDWAEKSMNALRSAPDIGMCLSGTFVANETSNTLFKSTYPKKLNGAILRPLEFQRSVMRYGSWMNSSTALYRRSAYDNKMVEFASAGAFVDGLIIYFLGLKAGVVVLGEALGVFFERESSVSGAIVNPRVGVKLLRELSNLQSINPCMEVIDRQLAFRMLQRNTYTYLMISINHLISEFSKISEKILPPIVSRPFRISLRLLFNLFRLATFACLRPFDLFVSRNRSHAATPKEKRAFYEYRKALMDQCLTKGVDS